MKLALFCAFLVASANALAQQAPRGMVRDQAPREVEAMQVPGETERLTKQAPRAPQLSNAELSELLRAQTMAIKALSGKVDSLEQRISRIEKGGR